jgi:bacillithiol biosynthesis cysteine-adding enzyme BshC
MNHSSTSLPYDSTGYFSKIVSDYIGQASALKPFYVHTPDLAGIRAAIQQRQAFNTPRAVLKEALQQQYAAVSVDAAVTSNIEALLSPDTFTVVTAHQPNIFTGPLYFIYKILHTIQLSQTLQQEMPAYRFVPVYYMGSEDADLDELGTVQVGGETLRWETNQTGAVGRMKVDQALLRLIDRIAGEAGVWPFGEELITLLKEAYQPGRTIQEATLILVNALFGRYGLLVLIPDQALLKEQYRQVVERELLEGFSHAIVTQTISQLSANYKVQAGGREINLFYLLNDRRERIEREGDDFVVKALNLQFSRSAMLEELQQYPERFSANVILRGAFQETILPNIAFIGGGGELAYWLELKEVFAAIQVPFPVLLLRNSFLLMSHAQESRMQQLGIDLPQLFQPAQALHTQWVKDRSTNQLELTQALQDFNELYARIQQQAIDIDASLGEHVAAITIQAKKKLLALEKKMLRAEKRKFADQEKQILQLKEQLFPMGNLQERTDNFSLWYARYGKDWLNIVLTHSLDIQPAFTVITLE